MKMGTIASPWRYDAAACHALKHGNTRPPAILHYASRAADPVSQGARYPSIAALAINRGIDVMCEIRTFSLQRDAATYARRATNVPFG